MLFIRGPPNHPTRDPSGLLKIVLSQLKKISLEQSNEQDTSDDDDDDADADVDDDYGDNELHDEDEEHHHHHHHRRHHHHE